MAHAQDDGYVDAEWAVAQYAHQSGQCACCGSPMLLFQYAPFDPQQATADRLCDDKPHSCMNCVLSHLACNSARRPKDHHTASVGHVASRGTAMPDERAPKRTRVSSFPDADLPSRKVACQTGVADRPTAEEQSVAPALGVPSVLEEDGHELVAPGHEDDAPINDLLKLMSHPTFVIVDQETRRLLIAAAVDLRRMAPASPM